MTFTGILPIGLRRSSGGAPSLRELPTDKPRPSAMTYSGGCVAGHISVEARRTLVDAGGARDVHPVYRTARRGRRCSTGIASKRTSP